MTQDAEKEFIFVDESGDPGPDGNPIYILLALHVAEPTLDRIRRHLVAFRYHHDVTKELKVQRWADKFSAPARHLLSLMADLAEEGFAVKPETCSRKIATEQAEVPTRRARRETPCGMDGPGHAR